jgi:hypothetical protein
MVFMRGNLLRRVRRNKRRGVGRTRALPIFYSTLRAAARILRKPLKTLLLSRFLYEL